jgi:hypothetical protein
VGDFYSATLLESRKHGLIRTASESGKEVGLAFSEIWKGAFAKFCKMPLAVAAEYS